VKGQASGASLPKHRIEWLTVQPTTQAPGPIWGISVHHDADAVVDRHLLAAREEGISGAGLLRF